MKDVAGSDSPVFFLSCIVINSIDTNTLLPTDGSTCFAYEKDIAGGNPCLARAEQGFQAIARHAAAGIQHTGLGDSDFRVLEVLLHRVLSRKYDWTEGNLTPGSISVAVDRLYGKGLVSRVESAEDRRVRVVALTPRGRKLIVPVFRKHAAAMKKVFSALSSDELQQLEGILKKVGRRAEALGGREEQGS